MKHSDVIYIMGVRHILVDGRLVRDNRRGRPEYAGPYGEPTVPLRVPISLLPDLKVKMEELRQRESELRQRLADDFLYTSPGYRWEDLSVDCLIPRDFGNKEEINE